jgi:hypothetical protein
VIFVTRNRQVPTEVPTEIYGHSSVEESSSKSNYVTNLKMIMPCVCGGTGGGAIDILWVDYPYTPSTCDDVMYCRHRRHLILWWCKI